MNRIAPTIAFALLSLPGVSAADWYFVQGGSATTIRLESEGRSFQLSVRKVDLPVEALVLRHDTERADYFWLEIQLPDTRDSDGHLLVINGRSIGQVYTRGPKWMIGFSSLKEARRCLQYLHNFHHLDAKHVHDNTKV